MKPCDCLNDCGDDPAIRQNKAKPCPHYLARESRAKEARHAQYLVLKKEFEGQNHEDQNI